MAANALRPRHELAPVGAFAFLPLDRGEGPRSMTAAHLRGRPLATGEARYDPASAREYPASSQAIMPPVRFQTLVYPRFTSAFAAVSLMLPLRQ